MNDQTTGGVTQIPEQKHDHTGFWNPVTQTVMDLGDKLLIVANSNCKHCGHIETNMIPVNLEVKHTQPLVHGAPPIIKP